jgi:predicted O-linked N-acetylglucosamine transferase (SPINDLY family)
LRNKLAQNRLNCALFDTERFRRNLEAAFAKMWDIYRRGEAPHGFAV